MNKRSIPIILFSCFLAVTGIAGYLLPTAEETNPTRVLMENTGGRVVFTHLAHSTPGGAYGDTSCATCHHELRIGAPGAAGTAPAVAGTAPAAAGTKGGAAPTATAATEPVLSMPAVTPCKSCHGSVDNPEFVETHQKLYRAKGGDASCVSCHHARMDGLAEAWNHEDHKNYAGDDCESCHHPVRYEARPGKIMTIKPQKCGNCHTARPNKLAPTTLKTATHTRCQTCHEDWFTSKNDCATCHVQVATKDDLAKGKAVTHFAPCSSCHAPMPGNMDAYHKNCMTCHDKAGKGPGAKAPCAQCHTP